MFSNRLGDGFILIYGAGYISDQNAIRTELLEQQFKRPVVCPKDFLLTQIHRVFGVRVWAAQCRPVPPGSLPT